MLTSLVFLASTDHFYQFIYPAALIGLFPLGLLFRAACPGGWWPALVLFAILLLFVLLFRSLGWGDLEFLTVLLLALGWYPTALVLLTACLLTIIINFHAPPPRHGRVPFMPELAFVTGIIMLVMSPA
ncbi:prepilin peptidase [Limosilactobacillus oris]|uniref:prepilin peptidase n=1 Tax=Limosilactobacillus oris TaxID=1632 RepID=UPI0034644DB7